MSEVNLQVTGRDEAGKKSAKRLRRQGFIPAIYYSHGQEAVPLAVNAKLFKNILAGDSNVIDLDFGKDKPMPSIIKDIQWDPVTSEAIHIDFLGVKLDEKVVVEVPINFVGTARGAKNGGIVQMLLRAVEVECLPLDIPEHLEVDISELDIQDSLDVSVLHNDKVTILTEPDTTLVTVLPPRLETEEEAAESEEEAEEPEVVGKGKREEEDEED